MVYSAGSRESPSGSVGTSFPMAKTNPKGNTRQAYAVPMHGDHLHMLLSPSNPMELQVCILCRCLCMQSSSNRNASNLVCHACTERVGCQLRFHEGGTAYGRGSGESGSILHTNYLVKKYGKRRRGGRRVSGVHLENSACGNVTCSEDCALI